MELCLYKNVPIGYEKYISKINWKIMLAILFYGDYFLLNDFILKCHLMSTFFELHV